MQSPLAAPGKAATYRSLLFLVTPLVVAPLILGVLLAGWITTAVLAITPLVIPLLIGLRGVIGLLGQGESVLARELLDADTHGGRLSSGGSGFWGRGKAVVADPGFWRTQGYLVARMLLGFPLAVLFVSLAAASVWFVGLPIHYRWTGENVGPWHVDSLQKAVLLMPVGVIGALLTLNLVVPVAAGWRVLASSLLRDEQKPFVAAPEVRQRALLVQAVATAVVDLILLVVWAATGHGYFWPEWPLVATALPLTVFAWISYVLLRVDWQRRTLALSAGVYALLSAMLILFWAFAGGGYFWPFWPMFSFALVLVAQALIVHFSGRSKLEERIGVLETTRAGAVDVQESELRRIERDLHDGAQARLVALGMNLGMAEQKLDADPDAARDLVAEARVGVEEALRELRDLARGIHPPVLTDRGLEAAVTALAHQSAVPVFISADVPERPPAAVETAAYFVVAEAMANAAKHAGATRIDVRIVRVPSTLVVEVTDDGHGGADPAGSGLTGVRHRVEAIDGTLTIVSPSGGGTTLRAELPCVS